MFIKDFIVSMLIMFSISKSCFYLALRAVSSKADRRDPALRHSVPHAPRNFQDIAY